MDLNGEKVCNMQSPSQPPLVEQLHWLPVCQHIDYKLTYKVQNTSAPAYVSYHITPRESKRHLLRSSTTHHYRTDPRTSVVTVIETGAETAFFCKTEPKLWFYASVLTVRFWNGAFWILSGAALVSWTLTVGCSLQVVSPTRVASGCYRWDQRWDRRRPCTPRV